MLPPPPPPLRRPLCRSPRPYSCYSWLLPACALRAPPTPVRWPDAAALARAIKIVASGTTIGAEGPDAGRRQSWSVSFVVYAPRHSDLKLDTYNGPIGVREVSGRMTLTAYNGPISLTGVGGDVRARTTNGPL